MIKKRILGNSGIEVNPVGLGCMGFSHAYGTPTDKSDAIKLIRNAYDMGYDFFDTAEAYIGVNSDGTVSYNEELVGEALKPIRSHVVIATKFGIGESAKERDSKPETIRKSVEKSLKRLGTDYIDLYYQHREDPNTPIEEVAEVMSELIKEGKIRAWGLSEADAEYMRRANAVCKVSAVENRYSMMGRFYEKDFPAFEELNIAYVAYSPLANGILTGKYKAGMQFDSKTDFRAMMPQFQDESYKQNEELFYLISSMAEEKNATMSQISLAWMLNKKPWIIPIPGSRKPERMKENQEAANVRLSSEDVKKIDSALNKMKMSDYFGGTGRK